MDIAQTASKTVIVAEDEAALYLQATTMAGWAPRGCTPVIPVNANRTKTNFYGTLNLLTGEEMVTQATKMNAEATAQHLHALLLAIPTVPILLLWDRATWHRGPGVQAVLAANPRLSVLYFPVAGPDLNPQEQVWKATRRAVSHNHLVPRLPELADKFKQHLTSTTFHCSFLDRYAFNQVRMMSN